MAKITVEFEKEEARVVRFLLAGAPHMHNVSPPDRLASQDALTKMDAAISGPVEESTPKAGKGKKQD